MNSISIRHGLFAAPLLVATLLVGAVACHKDETKPAEGPMERAGKSVDNTAGDVKDGAQKAGNKASDDATDAKDTVKKKWNDAGL